MHKCVKCKLVVLYAFKSLKRTHLRHLLTVKKKTKKKNMFWIRSHFCANNVIRRCWKHIDILNTLPVCHWSGKHIALPNFVGINIWIVYFLVAKYIFQHNRMYCSSKPVWVKCIKEDILKNVSYFLVYTMEVIFFLCVFCRSHTAFERHECKLCHFWVNQPFNVKKNYITFKTKVLILLLEPFITS